MSRSLVSICVSLEGGGEAEGVEEKNAADLGAARVVVLRLASVRRVVANMFVLG